MLLQLLILKWAKITNETCVQKNHLKDTQFFGVNLREIPMLIPRLSAALAHTSTILARQPLHLTGHTYLGKELVITK